MKRICFLIWACLFCMFLCPTLKAQAPINDDCSNALPIIITGNGYDFGTFNSVPTELANATVQPGESFAPAILGAGLSQKSVWYKFSIPTARQVKVTLAQAGNTITAGDVGFTVYKFNSCLPVNSEISSKLTPIAYFENC